MEFKKNKKNKLESLKNDQNNKNVVTDNNIMFKNNKFENFKKLE